MGAADPKKYPPPSPQAPPPRELERMANACAFASASPCLIPPAHFVKAVSKLRGLGLRQATPPPRPSPPSARNTRGYRSPARAAHGEGNPSGRTPFHEQRPHAPRTLPVRMDRFHQMRRVKGFHPVVIGPERPAHPDVGIRRLGRNDDKGAERTARTRRRKELKAVNLRHADVADYKVGHRPVKFGGPSRPSAATTTRKPSSTRISFRVLRTSRSSSTSKMEWLGLV